ncbi:MAG: hypothetical protein ACKVJW_03485 [Flavobacteriales bacterium]|jgi:hypothetical protein|tara:strand:+ start:3701 stop:4432 length:732 start_codon:yes stop_codon:yes gene_type:complete
MKKMLLILFCIPLFIFGQNTSGTKYSLSTGYYHLGITLNENDSFEFNEGGCTFIRSGEGTYKIEDEKLLLEFSKSEKGRTKKSCFVVVDSSLSTTDSSTIEITVLDNNTILPYVNVVLYDSIGLFIDGKCSKNDGPSKLKHQSKNEIVIHVSYVGYPNIKKTLNPNYNYGLVAKMNEAVFFRKTITDTTYVYNIQSKSKRLLRINLDDNYNTHRNLWKDGKVPQLAQDLEKLEYFIRTTFYIY